MRGSECQKGASVEKEPAEENLGKNWMSLGAVLWCHVQLDSENNARIGVHGIAQACELHELLQAFLESCFGASDFQQLSVQRMVAHLKMLRLQSANDRREVLRAIEMFLSQAHITWDLSGWAEDRDRQPPAAPTWCEKARKGEVQALDQIPLAYIARLLWALQCLCNRAREGEWSAFARLPECYSDNELPPELRDELSDIDPESLPGEDGS